MNQAFARSLGIGTLLQVAMVVIGHFSPAAQQAGLFPVAGTLIGAVTGWLAGANARGVSTLNVAKTGAVAGGVAGVLGSLVSTALGDVPASNVGVAGAATLVTGAIGAILRSRRS